LGKTAGRGEKAKSRVPVILRRSVSKAARCPLHGACPSGALPTFSRSVGRGEVWKRWKNISLRTTEVNPALLPRSRDHQEAKHDIVVLGNGDIKKALKVSAHRFTKSAREKIEKAGGAATVIGD